MPLTRAITRLARPLAAVLAVAWLAACPAFAQGTEKSRCFDFGGLSPELRAKSEDYLLQALDTEHLFTIASGMKAMSAGFYSAQVPAAAGPQLSEAEARSIIAESGGASVPALDAQAVHRIEAARRVVQRADAWKDIEELRTILSTWRCGGEIHAELVHYATPSNGNRQVQGVVFSLPALQRVLAEKSTFFSRWALTPNASPLEVLMAVEYSRGVARFAGYGYLFGYPDDAVGFFTRAAASEDATGQFVARDFRAIPTYRRETGQFTYAVEKGAQETDADRALKARAGTILEAYRARRAAYIGPGKPGAAALLRDWFCPSEDDCSPVGIPH